MTSQLPANQAHPRSQGTRGSQELPSSEAACGSETLLVENNDSTMCAMNGKPNGGKDTILEEILHPRREEDIS